MSKVKTQPKSKVESKQTIKRRRVTFSFEATQAKEVILTGDFNNWDPKIHPMNTDGLASIHPFGQGVFQKNYSINKLSRGLTFTGKYGDTITPQGSISL